MQCTLPIAHTYIIDIYASHSNILKYFFLEMHKYFYGVSKYNSYAALSDYSREDHV